MSRPSLALLTLANYPFQCSLQTRFGDQDVNRHINNVAMAGLFEEGRLRFNTGLDIEKRLTGGQTVVAALNISFLADTRYPEDVVMGLGVLKVGRSSWTIVEGAFQDGRCVGVCEAVLVRRSPEGPLVLPEDWRALLETQRVAENG